MKTIIFDFDGTLTKKNNEIWRNIWAKLDALDIDDMLYTKFDNGEITYEQWSIEIEKEFIKRKLNKATLDELISKIELMDNLEETIKILKDKGYDLRILSGGINYVINNLLKDRAKYFSDIKCNNFSFDENGILTSIEDTDSDGEGKARYISSYIKQSNSKPEEIIFIGNGNNDRYVSASGCHTICLNPNGTNHEDTNIWHTYIDNTKNLKDILPLIEKIFEK
jgi:2,3-diketo-5-methylthio-1-phosphopentane phosphatase